MHVFDKHKYIPWENNRVFKIRVRGDFFLITIFAWLYTRKIVAIDGWRLHEIEVTIVVIIVNDITITIATERATRERSPRKIFRNPSKPIT